MCFYRQTLVYKQKRLVCLHFFLHLHDAYVTKHHVMLRYVMLCFVEVGVGLETVF